jgi:hypothetical protein
VIHFINFLDLLKLVKNFAFLPYRKTGDALMTKGENIELLRQLKYLKDKNIPPEYLIELIKLIAAVFGSNKPDLYYQMLDIVGMPLSLEGWQETVDQTLEGKTHGKYNPKKYSI